jgi:AraC family transcriptional regulator
MKPTQRVRYADRIERVVRHLESHAFDDAAPSLAELARIAAISEFHFHRVFRLMTGETVGAMVRRLRLLRALPGLASGATVAEAATRAGYGTPQSFARALRAQAGKSPSQARADTGALDAALRQAGGAPGADGPAAALSIEVISIEPFRLLAVRNVGSYAELNRAYERLFGLVLAQVEYSAIAGVYGVPLDDPRFTPAEEFRFDCALNVCAPAVPGEDLKELRLGGGAHARWRHTGSYDRLPESIDDLYAAAIDTLDREFADAPLYVHYVDLPEEVAEPELRSDIYLPLR